MPLIEDNYVIQQVSSATPNPALSNPVLPRAAIRGAHPSASHLPRGRDYVAAELRVMIEQEDFVDRSVRPYLPHLLHDPESIGIACDIEVQNSAPVVGYDKEAIQNSKGECRYREEVHRSNDAEMGLQEGPPRHAL